MRSLKWVERATSPCRRATSPPSSEGNTSTSALSDARTSRWQVAADNGLEKQNCRVDLPLCGSARSTRFQTGSYKIPLHTLLLCGKLSLDYEHCC